MDKIKVLIIEDDPFVLSFFKATTKKINITLTIATTLEKGVRAVAKDQFSVTFIAMKIKSVDGSQILKQLMQQQPDLNCFMMTSSPSDVLLPIAMENGAKGIIFKPPDLDQVASSIQRMEVIAFFEREIKHCLHRSAGVETAKVKSLKKSLNEAKEATGTDVKLE